MKVHLEKFKPIENYSKFIQQLRLNLYEISKKCLAEGSFKLYKWATNNDELAKLIKLYESDTTQMPNANDETYVKDSLGNSYTYQKVLVINGNATTDKFVFSDIINIASKLNVVGIY